MTKWIRGRGYGFAVGVDGTAILIPRRVWTGRPGPMAGEAIFARLQGTEALEARRAVPAVLRAGTVSWYDPARGFGYAESAGASYYLHGSELLVPGQIPQRGDLVTFWTPGNGNGDRAAFAVIVP